MKLAERSPPLNVAFQRIVCPQAEAGLDKLAPFLRFRLGHADDFAFRLGKQAQASSDSVRGGLIDHP